MVTIAQVVERIIRQKPFLENFLAEDLINYTSLARNILPEVEKEAGRNVNISAIAMALKRYVSQVDLNVDIKLDKWGRHLGDITVRSRLSDYTYGKSSTLLQNQKKLLELVSNREDVFFTFSQGVYEVNIVISDFIETELNKIFKEERLISKMSGLSSVTMRLPVDNVYIVGLYYYILKRLAMEQINIIEVISTTNEFSIIVKEDDISQAFNVLNQLKRQ